MKSCKKLHLAYADAVACGCVGPPETEFERLLHGMRPITAEDPSPVVLETMIQDGRVAAHRYMPRPPRDVPAEVARAYWAWVTDVVPWIDGPPAFVHAVGR